MNVTAIAKIDLSALSYNVAQIKQRMPTQKIVAMIKSNAYGHGLIPIAKALNTVDALGVATIAEALQLLSAGISTDIIVMRGFVSTEELAVFLDHPQLIACIHDSLQLRILEDQSHNTKKIRIWLKIETGMHRLGVPESQCWDVYQRLVNLTAVQKPFVVCTHLADADNADSTFTNQQLDRFKVLTHNMPMEKSVLNSAGIIAHPKAAYEWIRPGLLLYGVSPFAMDSHYSQEITKYFKPVMTLESKLIAVKKIPAHEKIGYSCTFTATHDMTIGIVGMGYGDSYPRQAKNGTPVLIRGERCPIVGRVSMDMITVDVSHLKEICVDDTVILWGNDLSVAEIAHDVNTVPHELLCHLTGRVQMRY